MDRTFSQVCEDAATAEDHTLERSVVGQHRNHDFAAAYRLHRLMRLCTQTHQGFGLARSSIVNSDAVARLEEVGCHARAHLPKPDESNLHGEYPCQSVMKWDRASHRGGCRLRARARRSC